ncbi:hypothetical protein PMG11_10068 [Penicillium brasilianum]|uniref:Uncharacterized protein n=1 Tax=Penicillium brasilianum TaxID=104259 RepID=A0A0F7U2J7_PENBI|nr:hypothetical protein PMG11_10068 [Penicillium brasilianum]
MKFSIAAIAGLASAAAAASLPAAFTLVADGGRTVLTDGENAWVGVNSTTHEILILRGGGDNGPVSFTSKSQTPTGFQSLYIVENEVEPVGLTRPHSAAVPEGANTTGFGVNDEGYFTHNGNAWFAIDGYDDGKTAKEIYWYGSHNAEFGGINLWVKECKGC